MPSYTLLKVILDAQNQVVQYANHIITQYNWRSNNTKKVFE